MNDLSKFGRFSKKAGKLSVTWNTIIIPKSTPSKFCKGKVIYASGNIQ